MKHETILSSERIDVKLPGRWVLLIIALVALCGPNALYVYSVINDPSLNTAALRNPVALAFMIEAMMLLALFLWFVYARTRSVSQVCMYLMLSFIGSLAFSFPLFLYFQKRDGQTKDR